MSLSRRPRLDRATLAPALSIIEDEVSKIVAEIAAQRPQPPAPKPAQAA